MEVISQRSAQIQNGCSACDGKGHSGSKHAHSGSGHGHSGCGCEDTGCNHEQVQGNAANILPAISFVLLAAGLVMEHTGVQWFKWPLMEFVWYSAAFLPVGFPVLRQAVREAMKKDFFNEFSLMSLAVAGAFYIGEYPEAVGVMLFYTLGERLQHAAVGRATRNIGRLLDVRPEHAEVFRKNKYVTVSPQEVRLGEQIEVKPGGRVPLDGSLSEEEALFDTSALTGESMPRTIHKGEEVLAGMIVYGQAVRIKVTRLYGESALARILALVKDASARKAPAELFIRRFARIYTPAVTLLALLVVVIPAAVSWAVPSFHYVFSEWLYRGLVFLVISCPCALVISIPLGYFGGIGAASRAGILFKGGNYLDAVTRVNAIAFDKTGTLTTGRFEVVGMECRELPVSDWLAVLLAMEQKSTHPVAQAIVRYALKNHAGTVSVADLRERAGYGMQATVNGQEILIGNLRLMADRGIAVPDRLAGSVATVVVCAAGGKYAGYLLLSDTLKEDAALAIERLKKSGITDISLLSGDKEEIVAYFARELKIGKAYGNLLPEDKTRHMEKMIAEPGKSVAFVGDGMNDAPVLALSHVGIAMGGWGADAAIESADVVIQDGQPSKVAVAVAIGRFTRKVVRQNIVGAIGVKGIILLAGALGYTTLWGAVFADVGVALLAVLNAVRILHKKF